MREKVSAEAIERFMKALGRTGKTKARIYFVGGVSALLLGWRESTIDIDLKLVPEAGEILKALPDLKERLQLNVELASPEDFIPPCPDGRSEAVSSLVKGRLISSITIFTPRHWRKLSAATALICSMCAK